MAIHRTLANFKKQILQGGSEARYVQPVVHCLVSAHRRTSSQGAHHGRNDRARLFGCAPCKARLGPENASHDVFPRLPELRSGRLAGFVLVHDSVNGKAGASIQRRGNGSGSFSRQMRVSLRFLFSAFNAAKPNFLVVLRALALQIIALCYPCRKNDAEQIRRDDRDRHDDCEPRTDLVFQCSTDGRSVNLRRTREQRNPIKMMHGVTPFRPHPAPRSSTSSSALALASVALITLPLAGWVFAAPAFALAVLCALGGSAAQSEGGARG